MATSESPTSSSGPSTADRNGLIGLIAAGVLAAGAAVTATVAAAYEHIKAGVQKVIAKVKALF